MASNPTEIEETSRPPTIAPTSALGDAPPRRGPSAIARRSERVGEDADPPAIATGMRARIAAARLRGDVDGEAIACARLARHLVGIDARLDEAVTVGRRAIALRGAGARDEGAFDLRRLLAKLLRALGEPGLASATLRPVVDATCARAPTDPAAATEAVEGLLTLGDLLLRSGDLEGAIDSFKYVAVVAPERPDGQERLASAHGVAPESISADSAARAYIGAAKKYQLGGNDPKALEALARAFEVDPSSALAAHVFADTLEDLGRAEAADSVRAEYAAMLGHRLEEASAVHASRREKAKMRGDRGGEIAATLDELVALVIHAEPGSPSRKTAGDRLDAALEEALPAVAVARRRVRALLETGASAVAAWRDVAESAPRSTSAGVASRVEALREVVARDVADERALASLREHARVSRDPTAIVDALVRALRRPIAATPPEVWASRAAELALWAEEHLDEPVLAAWAWRRVAATSPNDATAAAELARLRLRLEAVDAVLEAARVGVTRDDLEARAESRRQLVRLLGSRPDEAHAFVDVAVAHLHEHPEDRATIAVIDRVVGRLLPDEASRVLRAREEAAVAPHASADEQTTLRVARVEAALVRGDLDGARALLEDAQEEIRAAGLAPHRIALAERAGGGAELAAALVDLEGASSRERAAILAAAARASRLIKDFEPARTYAELAMRADPRDLRGAIEIAELAVASEGVVPSALAGACLERVLAGVGSRARWSLAVAGAAEAAGETALAAAWTRRAWSLRPGDVEIARAWLARAVTHQDAELVAEVVGTTTTLVTSLATIAADLAGAVRALATLDGRLCEEIARELLSIGATRIAPVREALLEAAKDRPPLHVAVRERWLASGGSAADRAVVLLDVAEVAREGKDFGHAVDAAARVIEESASTAEQRSRARAIIDAIAEAEGQVVLPPDAELLVRESIATRKKEEVAALLTALVRPRLSDEQRAFVHAASDAFRALGRDRWDLAGDREGALAAWLDGQILLGEDGLDRLAADIGAFGGESACRDALIELARKTEIDGNWPPGPLAPSLKTDFRIRAWEQLLERPPSWVEPVSLAREAVARCPDAAALLPKFESLVARLNRPDVLDDLYDLAAGRAAGKYGERGVRYRAARVLDRSGRSDEALTQALRAFSAVPGEGAILVLVERLARSQGRADLAVNALVEAAESAGDSERRAAWLDRAATIAREAVRDPAERFDLLLRLFLTAPSSRTATAVVETLQAVVAVDADAKDTLVARVRRAHKKVDRELGYVDRLPVLAVVARAIAEFASVDDALDLVAKGAHSTPRNDLDPLRDAAEWIAARDVEAARGWLDRNAEAGGPVRANVAYGAGDADRAIAELVSSAPEVDEFDFSEPTEGPTREVALLERWAPHARDKAALARAWEKFGRRAGADVELEAVRALDEAGKTEEAARTLVRLWQGRAELEAPILARVVEQASQLLPQAGLFVELVEMLVDDLEHRPDGDVVERAARWREVADLRANKLGDRASALEALFEAGRLVPGDEELWNEVCDLSEALGAHDRLAAALAQRLQRAKPDRRVQLLRRLARVLEHELGRDEEASERWAELVRLLPLDAEAADALERIAERRPDRSELVDLLRARAARLPVGHPDRTRALRRLARELESSPSRRGEVLSAIREVHQQAPSDADSALTLARLSRAAGDMGTAADALLRAFRASTPGKGRVSLAIEAARALLELHDHDGAARVLHDAAADAKELGSDARALELLRLMLEIAIARSDAREEALTRVRIAELDTDASPAKRAANCSAAARALLTMGEHGRAKELAWQAGRAAPSDPAIVALVAEVEFGHGAAQRTVAQPGDDELLRILQSVGHLAGGPSESLSMVAFARAELLDVVQGAGAGYRDLVGWPEEVRAQPLVQLAFAERLAAEWSFAPATAAYERAFVGDLKGFRALGPTALRASDAAARSNDVARAKTFLDLAARDPACRIDARRRAVELARALGDQDGAIRALQRLAQEATGAVRAQALGEQARLLVARDPEAALDTMKLAVEAAPAHSALRTELEKSLEEIERRRTGHSLPPAPPPELRDSAISSRMSEDSARDAIMRGLVGAAPPPDSSATSSAPESDRRSSSKWLAPHSSSRPPPEQSNTPASTPQDAPPTPPPPAAGTPATPKEKLSYQPRLTMTSGELGAHVAAIAPRAADESSPLLGGAPKKSVDLEALAKVAQDVAAPVAERVRALKTLGEASHAGGHEDDATRFFISALELGDLSAGDAAAELLALLPGRASDLLLVRRRQAFLAPGDPAMLDALHAAALATRDHVFARAIDHVRRAFDAVAGPVPPPPLDLQLDRPDLVVPLLERRSIGAAMEASRLAWETASPLFRRELAQQGITQVERILPGSTSAIGRLVTTAERLLGVPKTPVYIRQRKGRDVEAILTTPPSVVLGGDCTVDSAEVRFLLGAGLVGAHPNHALLLAQPDVVARGAWQALLSAFGPPGHGRGISPEVGRLAASLWQAVPRAQQRRLGELLGNAPPDFDTALEGARQVARRAGLYLSADLSVAIRAVLAETGRDAPLRAATDLPPLCSSSPAVADLVRLATSPEFAEARWRFAAGLGRRPSSASGNTPPAGSRRG